MLLKNGEVITENHTLFLESTRYSLWWEGILFIKGVPSDDESVERFLQHVASEGLVDACKRLSGSYSCLLLDKTENKHYAFIDNEGMSVLLDNGANLSTSLLKLLKLAPPSFSDLNPFCVVEFVYSSALFHETAFFDGIRFLNANDIIEVSKDGRRLLSKGLQDIRPSESPESDFIQVFSKIAASIRNKKLSFDLSGGGDTRLMSVLAQKEGLEFETATSAAVLDAPNKL